MIHTSKEKWLILDDVSVDRLRAEQALAPLYDVEFIHAATSNEALDLLDRNHISLCLLDFYLARGTSMALIASTRKKFPHMPIVVVSGDAGRESPIYQAGADAIVPKSMNSEVLSQSLQNGILQAQAARRTSRLRVERHQPWIHRRVKEEFRRVVWNCGKNILLLSEAGMGKTALARELAEQIRTAQGERFGRGVFSLSCAALDSTPSRAVAFDESLFGAHKSENGSGDARGILLQSEGAVLVVDDAHLLPDGVQRRLKAFFEEGQIKNNSGITLDASRTCIIFTCCSVAQKEGALIPGFLSAAVSERVRLPTFVNLAPEAKKILSFWLRQSAKNDKIAPIKAEPCFEEALLAAVLAAPHRISMRSFMKTLDHAAKRALAEKRAFLLEGDLDETPFLYENDRTSERIWDDDEEVKEFMDAATSRTIEAATALLRRFMIKRALAKTNGNKSKAAAMLGISRQAFYAESASTPEPSH